LGLANSLTLSKEMLTLGLVVYGFIEVTAIGVVLLLLAIIGGGFVQEIPSPVPVE
jgi:hypothetical protein